MSLSQKRRTELAAVKALPAVTRDGLNVSVMVNAGLAEDAAALALTGADGIGLFRTEFQFLVSASFPRIREQLKLYRAVLDAAAGRPVTFRSLDIGGDKVLPYMRRMHEENPALGWRGVRLALDRPGLLRSQVRALLQAAAGRELRLMFPLIAQASEFDQAREIVSREAEFLRRYGHELPAAMKLGAMVEAPSILFELEALLQRVDFISVGSNDLFQFLYAAARGKPQVGRRFDPLSAPLLRALGRVVEAAKRAGVPVTLCGELAGRPLEAMALIGLGYRSISLSPAAFGPVKSMILALEAQALERLVRPCLEDPGFSGSMRERLQRFAEAHGVPV
jgi:phosphotransferase system enzyme I (PtsP)